MIETEKKLLVGHFTLKVAKEDQEYRYNSPRSQIHEHIYNQFVEVSGHNLECSQSFGYAMTLQTSFKPLMLKGTVSRDFLLLVLFMNQFPPSPRVVH